MNETDVKQGIVPLSINGGIYPNENATWRVCCWITVRTEADAVQVQKWLSEFINAAKREPPPPAAA